MQSAAARATRARTKPAMAQTSRITGRIPRQSAGRKKPYRRIRIIGSSARHSPSPVHRLAERAGVQHDALDAFAAAPLVHRVHQAPPQALLAMRGLGVDVEHEPAARIHAERTRRPRDHDQSAAADDRSIRRRRHPAAIGAVGNRGARARCVAAAMASNSAGMPMSRNICSRCRTKCGNVGRWWRDGRCSSSRIEGSINKCAMTSPRQYRAGQSVEDHCRSCHEDRIHTVIVVDGNAHPLRVACDFCRSEHNYRGGPRSGAPSASPRHPIKGCPRETRGGRGARTIRRRVNKHQSLRYRSSPSASDRPQL